MQSSVLRYVVGWLLILAVLAICISPFVDLPSATLNNKCAADLFLAFICAAIFLADARLRVLTPVPVVLHAGIAIPPLPAPAILVPELACIRI